MLLIARSGKYKRSFKKIKHQGLNLDLLYDIIFELKNGNTLPPKNKNHTLKGKHKRWDECHIQNDWVLIYRIENGFLYLKETGSHSEIF